MNFDLGPDERLLADAVRTALSRHDTLAAARAALEPGGPPVPHLWPEAVRGGWSGLPDLLFGLLVLIECGRRLAPTGLAGHLAGLAVLRRNGLPTDDYAIGALRCAYLVQVDAVPDAPGADHLILPDGTAVTADVTPIGGHDPTRPLGRVALAEPDGEPYGAQVMQALLAAEALGVAQAALDLAVAHAKQRTAFGRAIGSFQAVKHQLVDVLRRVENARSLLYYAAYADRHAPADLGLAACAARLAADDAADVATRRCLSVLGGLGATWEHDAHLYFRRAQLGRLLLGGAAVASEGVIAGAA
ncbi:MAG: acyl-CoA dehydrogenase [Hamadaea sp.]|nr:acyl-CoA dehydrogenase [Hamadaea sp.]